jgi:hypothetical protein
VCTACALCTVFAAQDARDARIRSRFLIRLASSTADCSTWSASNTATICSAVSPAALSVAIVIIIPLANSGGSKLPRDARNRAGRDRNQLRRT